MNVRCRVELSQAERDELTAMLGGGKHAARKLKRRRFCWRPIGVLSAICEQDFLPCSFGSTPKLIRLILDRS